MLFRGIAAAGGREQGGGAVRGIKQGFELHDKDLLIAELEIQELGSSRVPKLIVRFRKVGKYQ